MEAKAVSDMYFAIERVIELEGGFVNDPLDPGGATKYGITLATLAGYFGRPCSVDQVRDLSRLEAFRIYQTIYWLPLGADKLTSTPIAAAMFDAAVLFGVGVASLYAQKAASECGFSELRIDGHIGPKTLDALNSVSPKAFLKAFQLQFVKRIADVIARRPTSERFRHGWEERVARYPLLVS